MADSLATGARRVKVYVLTDDQNWDDRGTGHVRCEHDPHANAFMLRVVAEESGHVSLCSQVRSFKDVFYQIQDNTIISWTEQAVEGANSNATTEIALSFAEADGCREIWEKICDIDALFKSRQANQSTGKQHVGNASNSSRPSHVQQSDTPQGSSNLPNTSLSLPLVVSHDSTASGHDVLGGASDGALHSSSAAETGAMSRGGHSVSNTNPLALVDPSATADIGNSARFFEEPLDNPPPWTTDPIEEVIFRDNSSVLFLATSPGALVPAHANSDAAMAAGFAMPDPDRAGLEHLSRIMSDQGIIGVQAIRERITSELATSDYIPKLCCVFRACEDAFDVQGLSLLYHIMRCLFIIGNASVLEILINEKNLMDVVGCLEYDADHIIEIERRKEEVKRVSAEQAASERQSEAKDERAAVSKLMRASKTLSDGEGHKEVGEVLGKVGTVIGEEHVESEENSIKCPIASSAPSKNPPNVPSKSHFENAIDPDKHEVEKLCVTSSDSIIPRSNEGDERPKGSIRHYPEPEDKPQKVVVGYDSELKQPQKNLSEETTSSGNLKGDGQLLVREHRDFLVGQASFKAVVPIYDQSVLAKVHQNYRVCYIRDVILLGVFDETLSGALSGVVLCNNVDIIMYFISDNSSLQLLLDRLRQTVEKWRDLQKRAHVPSCLDDINNTAEESADRSPDSNRASSDDKNDTGAITSSASAAECPTSTVEQNCLNRLSSEQAAYGKESNKSCSSGASNTSGETHATALCDPSTSKEVSSRALAKEGGTQAGSLRKTRRELQDMLGFLRELSALVKSQQPAVKNRFHTLLTELGTLEITVGLLLDGDQSIRSLSSEILSAAILHDQTEVRAHILKSVIEKEKVKPKRVGISLRSAVAAPSKSDLANTSKSDMQIEESEQRHSTPRKASCRETPYTRTSDCSAQGDGKVPESGLHPAKASENRDIVVDGDDMSEDSGPVPTGKVSEKLPSDPTSKGESVVVDKLTNESGGSASNPSCSSNGEVLYSKARPVIADEDQSSEATNRHLRGLSDSHFAATTEAEMAQRDDDINFPLLSSMIGVICRGRESGFVLTVLDLLRVLLDPASMRVPNDKELFLDVFYGKFVARLLVPIVDCYEAESYRAHKGLPSTSDGNVNFICDLISYCVGSHAYRSKYFVLGFDVGGKLVRLLAHRKAHIRLSALRFIRASIGLCDDMFDRYIIREELLAPVMSMFEQNGYRDNLVGSAVLNLVHFLASAKRFELLKHLLSKYSAILEPSTRYSRSFGEAKKVFEEMKSGNDELLQERRHSTGGNLDLNGTTGYEDLIVKEARLSPDGVDRGESGRLGMFGATGGTAAVRFVPVLLGQDLRGSQDLEEDKFLSRCGADEQALDDLHSFIDCGQMGDGHQLGGHLHDSRAEIIDCWVDSKTDGNRASLRSRPSRTSEDKLGGDSTEGNRNDETKPAEADRLAGASGKQSCKFSQKNTKIPTVRVSPDVDVQAPANLAENGDENHNHVRRTGSSADGGLSVRKRSDNGGSGSGSLRLSLSKSELRGRGFGGDESGENSDLVCESSDDSGSPRKRERVTSSIRRGWMADGGIETCTQAVMEMHKDGGGLESEDAVIEESPPKRRRMDKPESREDVVSLEKQEVGGRIHSCQTPLHKEGCRAESDGSSTKSTRLPVTKVVKSMVERSNDQPESELVCVDVEDKG